jgi:RHS repeat-associated protein
VYRLKEITPSTTVYYYREPGGELLARQEGTTGSTRRYYHFDGLGSTSMLTNTSGDWTDKYSYDGWGNVLQHSTATGSIDQPYQYVGQLGYYAHYMVLGSADFRLLQLGVRFYDPQVGRFTQRDPIKDGINWYAYVGGNPVNAVDPDGLQPRSRAQEIAYQKQEKCTSDCIKDHCSDTSHSEISVVCTGVFGLIGARFAGKFGALLGGAIGGVVGGLLPYEVCKFNCEVKCAKLYPIPPLPDWCLDPRSCHYPRPRNYPRPPK